MTTGTSGSFFTRVLGHRSLFFALLAINLAIPFATHFYPTLDGPAHLHNAQLLKSCLLGDPTVREHFSIHPDPVPNWTDHIVLALLLCVFPAWLAEKILVCGYIALMAFGFRKLVRTLAPQNSGVVPLIFPLIHNELLEFGFYNFSIGIALMLWTLALEWNAAQRWEPSRLARLVALATALYFSNVLAFALTLLILLTRAVLEARSTGPLSAALRTRLLFLGLSFLPGLCCFLLFQAHVHYYEPDPGKPFGELFTWLLEARPLIVFGYDAERPFTRFFTVILLALLLLRSWKHEKASDGSAALLIAMVPVLLAFFLVPDSYSAGMMNDRTAFFFFLLAAIWIAVTSMPRWPAFVLAIASAALQLFLSYQHWASARHELDLHAQEVERAAAHLPAGSIVYPILLSDNWLHKHLSNYLGVDKPMIILENYEARLGWFPLRWRDDRPEQRCLAVPLPYGVRCDTSSMRLPDHVVLLGDTAQLSRPDLSGLREQLRNDYSAVSAGQAFVSVYKVKAEAER